MALAALRARLDAAGAATTDGETPPDAFRFCADDPWGNRLELLAPRAGGGGFRR